MWTVKRLRVRASRDEPSTALADAKAEAEAGSEDWQQWLADYEAGRAMILRFEVWVEVDGPDAGTIHMSNAGVWVEHVAHPPVLERQVAQLVEKDFRPLARRLGNAATRWTNISWPRCTCTSSWPTTCAPPCRTPARRR